MKNKLIWGLMAAIIACGTTAYAARMQEPPRRVGGVETQSTEQSRAAAAAYLAAVKKVLSNFAGTAPGFGDAGEKAVITSDDIAGIYKLEYQGGAPNAVRVTVTSPAHGHVPVNDENNRYFPGLNLQVNIYVGAETPELVGFVSDLIRKAYRELEKRDPVYTAPVIAAAEPVIRDIYNAIAKLEPKYPALKGFRKNAHISMNPENLTFGVFFEKDMGKSTKSNPAGELLTPESCYIGFYVGEYIEFMSRYTTSDPAWHFDTLLPNRNIEISWTVNMHDEALAHKLYDIVKQKMKPFEALDPDARPAFIPGKY